VSGVGFAFTSSRQRLASSYFRLPAIINPKPATISTLPTAGGKCFVSVRETPTLTLPALSV
jgi:hypothetical protein